MFASNRAPRAQLDIKIGKWFARRIKKGLGGDRRLVVEQDNQLRACLHERQFFVRDSREIEFRAVVVTESEDDRLITLRLCNFDDTRLSESGDLQTGCLRDNNAFVHVLYP